MNRDGTMIRVRDLTKVYSVPVRNAGLRAAVTSLFKPEVRDTKAVDQISFDVQPGEIVGFLGPNGAGKTTTLKMLSGLLHATSGELQVNGFDPWRRDRNFLRQISLIMGNRSQLTWDIPVIDSLNLFRAIYRIPQAEYKAALDELVDLLGLEPLLSKPVRNLSLGERMKCEFAAALLHRPPILFLDEPTLGLDLTAQRRMRSFIAAYNKRFGSTILLTSHYMADVEALCQRVVIIHRGQLLYDGLLSSLVDRFSAFKTIIVEVNERSGDFARYGEITVEDGLRIELKVPKTEIASVMNRLLEEQSVADLTIKDPAIDEVIERIFMGEGVSTHA